MSSSFFGTRRRESRKRAQRSSQRRRVLFEQLEDRRLLAADWHNPVMATDVNADQHVTPLDALRVINKLDADGSGQLPTLAPGARPNAYYDTTGDGFLAPLDALLVINSIEADALMGPGNRTNVQPLVDVVPVDTTTILASYDRPMDASAIDPANYTITGDDGQPIEVIGAVFAEGESVVQLQTAQLSSAGYTVNIQNVTDGAGQNVFFEGRKLLTGNPKGAVVSVAATSSTRVVVVFNEAVADNALAPQNYSIKDSSGKSLPVTDVRFNGPLGMVFVLTTAAQSNVNYRLTVTNVTDLQNDELQSNTGNFQGIAGLPKLLAATPAGPNSILLTFNQAMSDDALSPSAYVIKNSAGATLSVLNAQFIGTERRLIQLTTGPQSPGIYTIQSITATDINGNPVTPPGTIGSFQGAPAPSLVNAIPTDTTHVVLTFGSPVGDSALAPSSYKLEKLDSQGNVANTLPISAAEFIGSQRTVVSLTMPHQSDAQYRISTTSSLSDATGSPLAVVSREFQGLGTQPKVISATSTGPTAVLVTFSVPMSDDALTPASYEINDASGASLTVTNAQFVGTDRRVVQLTTGRQAAGTYSIVSITATDLGGSQVASPGPAGEFEGAPAPILTKASPTDPTQLVLTFTGPVSDSALAPSSYLLEKLDAQGDVVGSLAVSAAAFIGSQNSVVSLTTPYLADGLYRISTTSALTDTTGSPLEVVQIEFQGVGAQPKLLGATSTGPSTVLLITSAAVSDDVLAPSSYVIMNSAGGALNVLSAQFIGTERRVVQLTTAPQSARAYTVLSIAANDLSGNPLASPGATGVFQGAPEPSLVRSIPTDPTHIILTFGGPVGDSALAPSSYQIDKLDAQGDVVGSLAVNSAAFVGDQRTVVSLTTPYQADARYRISTTTALADATGAPLAQVQQEFQGVGSPAKLVAVTSTRPVTIQAIFNVPMSDDALSPASYAIEDSAGGALRVLNVKFVGTEQRVVELTTAPQAAGSYTIQSITATDINGSPVTAIGSIGGFQGSPTTTMSHAAPADPTHIILTFGGPVGDSALAPSSYIIERLDAQGNAIGSLSVSSAAFIGDQHRVVSLTTPFQTSGQYRISTTSALRDASGASLPAVQLQFQGLGIPAQLVGAASTGSATMLLTFNVSMSDDVLSPSSYVINNSVGVSLPVVSAQFVGTERRVVKLTTGPQSSGIYTIASITATDVSGNSVSSNLSVGGVQGTASPSLNIATATDSTHIYLTFAGPVGDSALSPSSYHIEQLDGQGNVVGSLAVNSSAFVGDQRTVVAITTPAQSDSQYRLATTSNLADVSGSPVPVVQIVFQGVASQATLVGATSTGSTTMLLTFNVSMSDDALSPSSYVINNSVGVSLPVVSAQFVGTERRVVQLTTGPQSSNTYTIQSITATDVSGNSVSSTISVGGIPGTASPSLNIATATDSTHIYLTFAGPVGDSALSPSSYQIQKLDVQGNVIGNLAVSSAAFVGNQRTVVALTTPSQSAGPYRLTTTNTLTNVAGAPVPTVQINFQGVGSQAQLVAVSSTSSTTLIVTFNVPMSDDALSPSLYVIQDASGDRLQVVNAQFIGTERRLVQLATVPQTSASYTVVSINATDIGGGTTIIPTSSTIDTFAGPVTSGGSSVPVDGPPLMLGAASLSNSTVLVSFNEPMSDDALDPANYYIVQKNAISEGGFVSILGVTFHSADHRSVLLTTSSQNGFAYAVTAVNVTDQAGNALAPAVFAGGQRFDPATAFFPGRPANAAEIVDTDGDGLSDNVEVRGWSVTVTLLNGGTVTREVTSDPYNPDSDGDDLWDAQELNIGTDPRAADTDGDQLNDWAEFNEIYSDPWSQDTDEDGLDDFLEFAFFKTSPYFADTDGDQIEDGDEIFGNRNPRVSDLPRPEIEVGSINLQLDVRFSESNAKESRDLETKSVTSTLTQSESKSLSRQFTSNLESKMSLEVNTEAGFGDGSAGGGFYGNTSVNQGSEFTAGFAFEQTEESQSEMTREYENSFSTEAEVTSGFTVEREVVGAVMQVTVNLRNVSDLAYRVQNLQVTAFIQDPQDHSKLTPVATLLPDNEPEEGFTLGPFVTNRGPLIFSNRDIVPTLVESLMANSSGLIFRISNYDIVNEDGRNFAFISQDVVERTAQLVVDFGGARSLRAKVTGEQIDENQPGDETEIHRVATSSGQVIDTNFDGTVDDSDRRAIFDANGKEVGITLFDALSAVGLTRYEARFDAGSRQYLEYDGTGFLSDPSSTVWTANSVTFSPDPGFVSGEHVRVTGNSGDLEAGKEYFLRNLGGGSYGFYKSAKDSTSETVLAPITLDPNSSASVFTYEDFANKDDVYLNSYSTFIAPEEIIGGVRYPEREKIYRIRGVANNDIIKKYWEVLTPLGVDRATALEDLILKTDAPVSLNYVQDLDGDQLPADVEYFLRTSDSPLPFGAIVPGSTSFDPTDQDSEPGPAESVKFNTDPSLATSSLVRVTDSGSGLIAGQNYYVRALGDGVYSFYRTPNDAQNNSDIVNLTGEITAGIFSPTSPVTTNTTADSVSFDPAFATGTPVQVSLSGGGLTKDVTYYIRSLTDGNYSFYATGPQALATASEAGRVKLTGYIVSGVRAGEIVSGVFSPTKPYINPTFTDFTNQSITFDPAYATGTIVNVTQDTGGLVAGSDPQDQQFALKSGVSYFLRRLPDGSYRFYNSVADAITDKDRINLTANVTAGIFSPTPKGRDTDRDGLDDRFEALIGWTVSTPLKTYTVYSSPNRRDSNFDNPKLGVDSDKDGKLDREEFDGSDFNVAPAGWNDKLTVDTTGDGRPDAPNGLRDRFEVYQIDAKDWVLDPIRKDTDGDGINDATEIIGFQITSIEDGSLKPIDHTDPLTPFTDSDTFTDGFEKYIGLDPTDGRDTDEDGDGLPDLLEYKGWVVYSFAVSTKPWEQGAYAVGYGGTDLSLTPASTDLGSDVVKFNVSNAPNVQQATLVEVTGGGLTANSPYYLGRLREQSIPAVVQYRLYESAVDAILGTARGAEDLKTSSITSLKVLASKVSSNQSVDTDEDGLTDYEEFFLRTDPASKDTDNDGIEDRVEHLGYALEHKVGTEDIGIIKTNPLDADTDNDLRSDGDEAELVDIELKRWVVRATGAVKSGEVSSSSAYRVYSNPLVADADYDGLVDGEEFFGIAANVVQYRTDPNNSNTDGDKRDDGVEVRGGFNPLREDIRVTVVVESVEFDIISPPIDYELAINVRPPGDEIAGLSHKSQTVMESNTTQVGKVRVVSTSGFAQVFYRYYDENGALKDTDFESFVLTWSGGPHPDWTFDPGMNGQGVPPNARFHLAWKNVLGEIFTDSKVFTYTGNGNVAFYTLHDNGSGPADDSFAFVFQGVFPPYLNQGQLTNMPIGQRSEPFGLGTDQHFSIEGFVRIADKPENVLRGQTLVKLGGLDGARAFQTEDDNEVRSVFSYGDLAKSDTFIKDYYFEEQMANGVTVKIKFYIVVG